MMQGHDWGVHAWRRQVWFLAFANVARIVLQKQRVAVTHIVASVHSAACTYHKRTPPDKPAKAPCLDLKYILRICNCRVTDFNITDVTTLQILYPVIPT